MPQPYTHKPRRCEGCQTPIALPRHTRTKRCHRCQKVYAHSRNVTQGAIRYYADVSYAVEESQDWPRFGDVPIPVEIRGAGVAG